MECVPAFNNILLFECMQEIERDPNLCLLPDDYKRHAVELLYTRRVAQNETQQMDQFFENDEETNKKRKCSAGL